MCIYNFPDSILSVIFGLAKYFIYFTLSKTNSFLKPMKRFNGTNIQGQLYIVNVGKGEVYFQDDKGEFLSFLSGFIV